MNVNKKHKILIVDDDQSIFEALKIILETEGYEIETLSNFTDIFSLLEHIKPDLLILDIFISVELDGREVCLSIKTNDKLKDLPVILFSADNIYEDVAQKFRADDFLAKPFEIDELLDKLKKHL